MLPLSPTDTIARYRLDAVLGQGGMGVVYLAHDTHLCRPVAIKVLAADRTDGESRQRFREEALILSRLNHPNIATVFDFGFENGIHYLVMEFVPGATIDRLLSNVALPPSQVPALGAQLAQGLAAAHAAGVIHRDVKPSNLCVTPGGMLKVLDFGVAISPAALASSDTTGSGRLLLSSLAGTLKYMAPERLRGAPADARTDIFSAGLVLYEMACGRLPYRTEHPVQLIEGILSGKRARPRCVNPGIDSALERVILRALSSNPDRRYQRATELAADLEKISLAARAHASKPSRPSVTAVLRQPQPARAWARSSRLGP